MKNNKYYVIDWAGNFLNEKPFVPCEFKSYEDAMEMIDEITADETETSEWYVIDGEEAREIRKRTRIF